MTLNTLRELYAYNRWANDKAWAIADGLSAEQLDRPFEMGLGSIRNTLHHIWASTMQARTAVAEESVRNARGFLERAEIVNGVNEPARDRVDAAQCEKTDNARQKN